MFTDGVGLFVDKGGMRCPQKVPFTPNAVAFEMVMVVWFGGKSTLPETTDFQQTTMLEKWLPSA